MGGLVFDTFAWNTIDSAIGGMLTRGCRKNNGDGLVDAALMPW
jgi:hypothetical protein